MEFTINNTVYRAGRLDAFKQAHIVRRLVPCLGGLASLADNEVKLTYDADGKVTGVDGDISEILRPLTNAITSLQDGDVEYIFNACLEVTERKQAGGKWAPLRAGGVTMFDGLSLPVLLQIAYYAFRENLTDFLEGLPSLSSLEGFMKAKGFLG